MQARQGRGRRGGVGKVCGAWWQVREGGWRGGKARRQGQGRWWQGGREGGEMWQVGACKGETESDPESLPCLLLSLSRPEYRQFFSGSLAREAEGRKFVLALVKA